MTSLPAPEWQPPVPHHANAFHPSAEALVRALGIRPQCPSCGSTGPFHGNGYSLEGPPRLRCGICSRTFITQRSQRRTRAPSGHACPRCGSANTRANRAVDRRKPGHQHYRCRLCKKGWYLPLDATVGVAKPPLSEDEQRCRGQSASGDSAPQSDSGDPPTRPVGCWWRIETPDGPTSMGTCVACGAVREFKNYLVVRKDAMFRKRILR